MIGLACPVRDCGLPLERRPRALACAAAHAFDLARSGYCNLLQPQDRRAREPGDSAAATAARGRWLARGHGRALLEALGRRVAALQLPEPAVALDLGCGDGFMLHALAARFALDACGIDIARGAIEAAARRFPAATWIVANADRRLPVQDRCVHLVLSIFGRRPAAEIARVLAPGGSALVVLPAADDLVELRQSVLGQGMSIDRLTPALAELAPHLSPIHHETVRGRAELDPAAAREALALSYRGARHSQIPSVAGLGSLTVTLAHEIVVLRPIMPAHGPAS